MNDQVEPYFLYRAEQAFRDYETTRCGHQHERLNADFMPLAQWAQSAFDEGRHRRGVIVAIDGEIIAETFLGGNAEMSVWGVSEDDARRYGLMANRVDMALGALSQKVGKELFHVKYWQVCQGPGQKRFDEHPHDWTRRLSYQERKALSEGRGDEIRAKYAPHTLPTEEPVPF